MKNTRTTSLGIALAASLLVAASGVLADDRFKVSADGQEVVDSTSRLAWKRCVEGMRFDGKACTGKPARYLYGDAQKAAAGGWRIPTRDEATALLDPNAKKRPRLDAAAFPQSPSLPFWARRPESNDNLNQWLVNGSTGRVTANLGQKKFALRLVRPAA